MHEDIRKVQHDPFSFTIAFAAAQGETEFFRLLIHLVREGFDLLDRSAAADDEPVGNDGFIRHVNGDDVERLFIVEYFADAKRLLLDGFVQLVSSVFLFVFFALVLLHRVVFVVFSPDFPPLCACAAFPHTTAPPLPRRGA